MELLLTRRPAAHTRSALLSVILPVTMSRDSGDTLLLFAVTVKSATELLAVVFNCVVCN